MLRFLLLITFLSGCTTIHYRTKGNIAAAIAPKNEHKHRVEIKGKKEFYLWGLLPANQVVYVDDEMANAGLISAANIRISEFQTRSDFIYGLISFGMYVPKSYKIVGFGVKSSD
ncbi:MAG: hypothetical protein HN509_15230 [Halobacteriovoraceae bacterium]|jgi:hypothetical protein|nr:hypothetical protein [Halobacteriovoraceae bacterium]MBT5093306.1 hypothetical protein [Halobacteriovoraceae bacterium]